MAIDALSIPCDIPWKRVAVSRDMFDPRRGGSLPPKWRSSLTVYAYPVPVDTTSDDYPESRILYPPLSARSPGGSARVALTDDTVLAPAWWAAAAWAAGRPAARVSEYWGCVCAFAQLAIFPRDPDGVPIDDYPYVMDFEPKKRELYEPVSETSERLSGTSARLATSKSHTSTDSTEYGGEGHVGFSLGPVSFGGSLHGSTTSGTQDVNSTTADRSTERRETQGRTTQFSQMYQLFNGYHLGTNRALFVVFPRPHTDPKESGSANPRPATVAINLINGERKLEGIQEMFLVVHLPRTMSGFCIDAWLDTGHKVDFAATTSGPQDFATPIVITRRYVTGCAEFDGDRLKVAVPTNPASQRPEVIGEFDLDPGARFGHTRPGEHARSGKGQATAVVDHLNLLAAESRRIALSFQMSETYAARSYRATDTFRARALPPLRKTTVILKRLADLGYVTVAEAATLEGLKIQTSGDLFKEPARGTWPTLVLDVRKRLLDALVAAIAPKV
jgi:hypothetical protein